MSDDNDEDDKSTALTEQLKKERQRMWEKAQKSKGNAMNANTSEHCKCELKWNNSKKWRKRKQNSLGFVHIISIYRQIVGFAFAKCLVTCQITVSII